MRIGDSIVKKEEKHVDEIMNEGNVLTDKVVKDAVLMSHRSTEHLTPMLTITFVALYLITTLWFEGRILSFLVFVTISSAFVGVSENLIRGAIAEKDLGKKWYKAQIIAGNFERVEEYEDAEDSNKLRYAVIYSASPSPHFLRTYIDHRTYVAFQCACVRGDEIYVLRYPLFNNDGYGYIAYCPYKFKNTSSFKEPILRTQYKKSQPAIEEDPPMTNN